MDDNNILQINIIYYVMILPIIIYFLLVPFAHDPLTFFIYPFTEDDWAIKIKKLQNFPSWMKQLYIEIIFSIDLQGFLPYSCSHKTSFCVYNIWISNMVGCSLIETYFITVSNFITYFLCHDLIQNLMGYDKWDHIEPE